MLVGRQSATTKNHSITGLAHPLALRLLNKQGTSQPRVLEVGAGSGRNLMTLLSARLDVTSLDEDAQRVTRLRRKYPELKNNLLCAAYTQLPKVGNGYDAVLSTHALLHGDVSKIRAVLAEIRRILSSEGNAYFTLGCTADLRFGEGRKIAEATFAPTSGDEQGVPHSYFDEAGAHDLLRNFEIEELSQQAVDDIAGKWAHETTMLRGAVHWFVVAKKAR